MNGSIPVPGAALQKRVTSAAKRRAVRLWTNARRGFPSDGSVEQQSQSTAIILGETNVNNRNTRLSLGVVFPLVGLSFAGAAIAQTQADKPSVSAPPAATAQSGFDAGDIVVTARKRAESVQDVPISVSAVSGTMLQQRGIANLDSLTTLVSGVTVQRTANNVASFFVRGLGTGPGNDSFENSVALFIDGTYAGRPPEGNQPIFDLERVEIIKGTQAALLAKNTSRGAFSTTTRKPGSEYAFNFTGSYEFALGSHLLDGGVDVPISDTLAVRLSGQANLQKGWIRNELTDKEIPRTNSLAGRIVAVWKPTADFDATLLYQQYRVNNTGLNEQYAVDLIGRAQQLATAAGYTGFEARLDRRTARNSATFGDSYETNDGKRAIGTLNYRLGDYTLTSVSAYSEYTQDRPQFDNDELPGKYTDSDIVNGNHQFTQEIRLSSPSDRRLNFIVGAFYLHEKWRYVRTVDVVRGNLPASVLPITGMFFEDFRLRTNTVSGFGQGNFNVTDALTFSVGVRVTNERRSADFFRETLVPGVLTSVLYPAIAPATRKINATNVDGSVGVQYKLNRDYLLYASYSRGTKGGGFLSSPTNPDLARYDPEKADNYEVGGKFTFGRSHFNVALFQTNVNGFQQSVFLGGTFRFDPQDLKAKGVETEAVYEVSDALRLAGSLTYLHARRDDGTEPVNAPKWSGNVTASFRQPVGDDLQFTADAGMNFKSRVFYAPESLTLGYGSPTNLDANVLPGNAYATVDGRLAIGPRDGRWQVSLIGKNLLDKDILSYARTATFVTGASTASIAMPRTVALQFSIRR